MSNADKTAAKIYRWLTADDYGFLVGLRVHRTFDAARFEELLALLEQYAEQSKSARHVDKMVARCLFDVYIEIETSAYHARLHNKTELYDALATASEQLLEIVDTLLPYPSSDG